MPWNEVMNKWKSGDLKSGGNGKPVKSQRQAIAIMLSEKRKAEGGNTEYKASGIHHPGTLKRALRRIKS
jgi:hypothetical protein